MSIEEVIQNLLTATSGSRVVDGEIAQLVGWTKRTVSAEGSTVSKQKEQWFPKNSKEAAKVPFYTANLQHAVALALELNPTARIGFSWEDGHGGARIDNGPYIRAATPQLAVCIASVATLLTTIAQN